MYFAGIDIGSLTCDAIIIDENARICGSTIVPTGARSKAAIARALSEVLAAAAIDASTVDALVSTGYGRNQVDNRTAAVTEITCHARGAMHVDPRVELIIDVGGQDSKAIAVAQGKVANFAMNDKCAAGTGRFLEMMAKALEIEISHMGQLSAQARKKLSISSMCTVFAESEVVSLIADGAHIADIVSGLHASIADRINSLVRRVCSSPRTVRAMMTGGVAKNTGVVKALEDVLRTSLLVPEEPQIIGALGAALIARDRHL